MNARGTSRPVFSFALVPRRVPRQSHRLEFTCARARASKNLSLSLSLSLSVSPPNADRAVEREENRRQKESQGNSRRHANLTSRRPGSSTKPSSFPCTIYRARFPCASVSLHRTVVSHERLGHDFDDDLDDDLDDARDTQGPSYRRGQPSERHDVLCVCTVQCLLGANLVITILKHAHRATRRRAATYRATRNS